MKKRPLSIISGTAIVVLVATSFVACKRNEEHHEASQEEQGLFRCRVQDQGFEPVADAEVTAKISAADSAANPPPFSVKTDADGFVKFKLLPGQKAELTPRKKGYALADTNTTFQLASSPANGSNPAPAAIIKMWKIQGPEPLTSFTAKSQFQNAGVPVYFDFANKSFSDKSGDIRITLIRPDGIIAPSSQPDWTVHLETLSDGGLAEITPAIWQTTWWAPTTGYEQTRQLVMSTNNSTAWSTNAHAYYFVQSRQGSVYTKMSLNVSINADPKAPYELSVSGIANTNGSCNWEGNIGSSIPL